MISIGCLYIFVSIHINFSEHDPLLWTSTNFLVPCYNDSSTLSFFSPKIPTWKTVKYYSYSNINLHHLSISSLYIF